MTPCNAHLAASPIERAAKLGVYLPPEERVCWIADGSVE